MMHLAGYFAIAMPIVALLAYVVLNLVGWHFGDEVDGIETTHIRRRY